MTQDPINFQPDGAPTGENKHKPASLSGRPLCLSILGDQSQNLMHPGRIKAIQPTLGDPGNAADTQPAVNTLIAVCLGFLPTKAADSADESPLVRQIGKIGERRQRVLQMSRQYF